MWLIWTIALWVVLGIIGGRMCAHRGDCPFGGVLVGILAGPFALAYCWFLPMTRTARKEWAADEAMARGSSRQQRVPEMRPAAWRAGDIPPTV